MIGYNCVSGTQNEEHGPFLFPCIKYHFSPFFWNEGGKKMILFTNSSHDYDMM